MATETARDNPTVDGVIQAWRKAEKVGEQIQPTARWTPAERARFFLEGLGKPLEERVADVVRWGHKQRQGWYQRRPVIGHIQRCCSRCGQWTQPAIEVKFEQRAYASVYRHKKTSFMTYFFCLDGEVCGFREAVRDD